MQGPDVGRSIGNLFRRCLAVIDQRERPARLLAPADLEAEGERSCQVVAGEPAPGITFARFAEIRSLLDSVQELGDGVAVHPIPSTEAYASWADWFHESQPAPA